MLAILFPAIDPIAIQIGPLAIRWYALAYLIGFVAGWRYCIYLARKDDRPPTAVDFDDFLTWAVVGVILGGRLGYVLFYNTGYYLNNPLEALAVWHGGMSFHGGMLGVIAAIFLFAHRRGFSPLALGRPDLLRGADRPVLRADRQFRQRRALGPGDRCSLGRDLPRRAGRRPAPASQPTVRSGAGRPGAVHRAGHPRPASRPSGTGPERWAASSSPATASAGSSSSISGSPTRNWASCLAAT